MILGPWGGTFGGGTLVRCVRWGGGGGGWPMCCGGAECPCIILDVLALCKLFHSRAHKRLCTANSPSAIGSVCNSRSGCSVVVINSSHSADRFREKIHVTKGPRDKVANQIQTPGNLPPRTKNYDTFTIGTAKIFHSRRWPLSRHRSHGDAHLNQVPGTPGFGPWMGNRRQTVKKDFRDFPALSKLKTHD